MRIVFRPPASEVPDHHRAAAIFTLRNNALKFVVRDRMIFDLNGESLFAWYQAWTTRHRPALHDAIKFQPKIVMQASRSMFLNDIGVAARASDCALWFGGDAKAPLGPVAFQSRLFRTAHDPRFL